MIDKTYDFYLDSHPSYFYNDLDVLFLGKKTMAFGLGLACRIESASVGSCSRCVGCADTMWAVAASVWSVVGDIGAITGNGWDAQALCGIM